MPLTALEAPCYNVGSLNLKLNVHNVVVIGIIAVLFILAMRLAARTAVAGVPVVGDVVKLAASA